MQKILQKRRHGVICLVVINSKIFTVGLKDLNDGNPNWMYWAQVDANVYLLHLEIMFELLSFVGDIMKVQWINFLKQMLQYIVNNYKDGSTIEHKNDWKRAFFLKKKGNARKLKPQVARDSPSGDIWSKALVPKWKHSADTPSSNSSTDTSTFSLQRPLNEDDNFLVNHTYQQISNQ